MKLHSLYNNLENSFSSRLDKKIRSHESVFGTNYDVLSYDNEKAIFVSHKTGCLYEYKEVLGEGYITRLDYSSRRSKEKIKQNTKYLVESLCNDTDPTPFINELNRNIEERIFVSRLPNRGIFPLSESDRKKVFNKLMTNELFLEYLTSIGESFKENKSILLESLPFIGLRARDKLIAFFKEQIGLTYEQARILTHNILNIGLGQHFSEQFNFKNLQTAISSQVNPEKARQLTYVIMETLANHLLFEADDNTEVDDNSEDVEIDIDILAPKFDMDDEEKKDKKVMSYADLQAYELDDKIRQNLDDENLEDFEIDYDLTELPEEDYNVFDQSLDKLNKLIEKEEKETKGEEQNQDLEFLNQAKEVLEELSDYEEEKEPESEEVNNAFDEPVDIKEEPSIVSPHIEEVVVDDDTLDLPEQTEILNTQPTEEIEQTSIPNSQPVNSYPVPELEGVYTDLDNLAKDNNIEIPVEGGIETKEQTTPYDETRVSEFPNVPTEEDVESIQVEEPIELNINVGDEYDIKEDQINDLDTDSTLTPDEYTVVSINGNRIGILSSVGVKYHVCGKILTNLFKSFSPIDSLTDGVIIKKEEGTSDIYDSINGDLIPNGIYRVTENDLEKSLILLNNGSGTDYAISYDDIGKFSLITKEKEESTLDEEEQEEVNSEEETEALMEEARPQKKEKPIVDALDSFLHQLDEKASKLENENKNGSQLEDPFEKAMNGLEIPEANLDTEDDFVLDDEKTNNFVQTPEQQNSFDTTPTQNIDTEEFLEPSMVIPPPPDFISSEMIPAPEPLPGQSNLSDVKESLWDVQNRLMNKLQNENEIEKGEEFPITDTEEEKPVSENELNNTEKYEEYEDTSEDNTVTDEEAEIKAEEEKFAKLDSTLERMIDSFTDIQNNVHSGYQVPDEINQYIEVAQDFRNKLKQPGELTDYVLEQLHQYISYFIPVEQIGDVFEEDLDEAMDMENAPDSETLEQLKQQLNRQTEAIDKAKKDLKDNEESAEKDEQSEEPEKDENLKESLEELEKENKEEKVTKEPVKEEGHVEEEEEKPKPKPKKKPANKKATKKKTLSKKKPAKKKATKKKTLSKKKKQEPKSKRSALSVPPTEKPKE